MATATVGRPVVLATDLPFPRRQGKVRDIYTIGDRLLLVASDRVSAFDVVMQDGIPDKGACLTQISNFWFQKMADVVPNHLVATKTADFPKELQAHQAVLRNRAVLVERHTPLKVECIVRGYLIGSGWKDYQKTGKVCGITLPKGLRQGERLPEPIFTPSTKAEVGHDENISFEETTKIEGRETMEKVRELSLAIYQRGHDHAASRGIILADTKFEFGRASNGRIVLIDECLTPDSSRFWPTDSYQVGISPPSFDKQHLRDWLEKQAWNKTPPPPRLPADLVNGISARYKEAFERLTGKSLDSVLE